ncbi:MAG: UDP-N-acetylmuramoyl-L-alanyl-D-glutamate--2,6-diaminopimelate ligase [Gemmatimonadales bacterium]|jgi:UDP-N-acetylmuramoyl-L-alanyl-D-glutamate--2,6-diaminopimelate ligase
MMPLETILQALERAGLLREAPEPFEITGVRDDSRRVQPGDLFCAIEGTVDDGHRFVSHARERGAVGVVVGHRVDETLPQIVVQDTRGAAAQCAREWYGRPADTLRVIGVTGTNGKTTTVHLVRHLLNADGDAASIGTLGAFDGGGQALPGHANLTTPGAVELQAVLAALRDRGARTVVMEASSHALDQRRLETLTLAGAVYTNLSHDHLDYHPTFDAYRDAKTLLSTHLTDGAIEVVNLEETAWGVLPMLKGVRRVTYGMGQGDVRVDDVRADAVGSTVVLRVGDWSDELHLPLPGELNVANALAAAACAWGLGVAPAAIAERLAGAPQVPGRMERLVAEPFVVLRDYAHTPDALRRAIAALRPITAGRLVVLFGAGGDRDRAKRPRMGEVVVQGADVAVVTSDNPRTEDPDRIIDDIERGMGSMEHLRITDRREAIARTIASLEPGDTLLLAGKGHETYQVIGTERHPFDEREIVRAIVGGEGA